MTTTEAAISVADAVETDQAATSRGGQKAGSCAGGGTQLVVRRTGPLPGGPGGTQPCK